ncbi:MAG TPA: hypothetical protein VFE55_14875 [Acidimicrobiia bacterium]|nr:hypothetical protein [Acidimicrobiia bacterium]
MRRFFVTILSIALLGLGALPAHADDSAFNSDAFESFDVYAQAQAARGTMFAVGGVEGESERLVGAKVEVSKPASVYAIAAAFQRGLAAGYTYGAVLGRSAAGGKGIAPEPPPGESIALYPSEPREMTWEGPLTSGAKGSVIDGRSYAKALDVPAGRSGISLQHIDAGQLVIDHAVTASRGEPTAEGLQVEATSTVEGIAIGTALKIDRLVSRAYALIPATSGDAKGEGSTVITGARVNGVPVEITSGGIVVADQKQGGDQKSQAVKQVSESLAKANIKDVRLDETTVKPGDGGKEVEVTAAVLRVSYINEEFGASNPQGFRGGGMELGGATIDVAAQRAGESAPTSDVGSDVAPGANGGSGGGSTGKQAATEPDRWVDRSSRPMIPARHGR